MQYRENLFVVKIKNCTRKSLIFFLIFAQNIEAVLTSTHNQYFGAKIRKIDILPNIPYEKVGIKGVYISRTCFPDD